MLVAASATGAVFIGPMASQSIAGYFHAQRWDLIAASILSLHQINVTGTYTTAGGTELAGREIEAQVLYGPVSR